VITDNYVFVLLVKNEVRIILFYCLTLIKLLDCLFINFHQVFFRTWLSVLILDKLC
jgi:hypothetical protein